MKTFKLFILPAILFLLGGCQSYKIVTTLNADGSYLREIYAKSNRNEWTGIKLQNPFLFEVDSLWQISELPSDTLNADTENFDIKISRIFASPADFVKSLKTNTLYHPLVAPKESFEKSFRWFFTYRSYKAVFEDISGNFAIPLDSFLTKDEQKIWFTDDFSVYKGMVGYEMKDKLDLIDGNFQNWGVKTTFEVYFEAICDLEKENGGKYYEKLIANKDSVFEIISKKEDDFLEINKIYLACEKYFNDKYFSKYYSENESKIEDFLVKNNLIFKLPYNLFSINETFELCFDGKLVSTNATENKDGRLIWKINAMRFASENYELIAEYRTANIWAFVLTFLLVISAIVLFIKSRA